MIGVDIQRALRLLLGLLAVGALTIGVPATVSPHSFFLHYPYLRHWVDLLPPYNEHLTTDVGELYLAFGAVFAWAAWRPAPALVVPVCTTFGAAEVLHAAFHASHADGVASGDAIAEVLSLAGFAALAFASAVVALRVDAVRRRGTGSAAVPR